MKLKGAIFTVALLAAWPVGAQQQTNAPPAPVTITVERPKLHWLAPPHTVRGEKVLKPVEGLDRQAWATVVGYRPGTSGFPTAETHQGGLCVFWVDVEPTQIKR
jgi:hypothetical protein